MKDRVRRACSAAMAVAFLLAAVWPLNAETSGGGPRGYHLNGEFLARLARDSAGVLTAPLFWKASDALCLAGVVGASGLMYAFDGNIQDWAQDQRTKDSDVAMAFISDLGDAGYIVAFLGGLYIAGEVAPSLGLRKTAVLGWESLAVTSVVVLSLKCLTGRARPGAGKGSSYFKPFSFRSSFFSLPSGHAASAFAAATSIAEQSDSAVVDILVYGLAAAVAVSRVHQNKHWASDVFLGAAIGHFIARRIAGLNKDPEKKPSVSLGLTPLGLSLGLRF